MSRFPYSACSLMTFLLGTGLWLPVEAFWIAFVNPVHQDITMNGLNPLGPIPAAKLDGPKFDFQLNNGAAVVFSLAVIGEISDHNVEVDEFQGFLFSERHFDSDDMAGGSKRLVQLRQEIVNTLVDASFFDLASTAAAVERTKRAQKARLLLGEALHTVQDFYAHTNWVEMNYAIGTEIQSDLGNQSIKSPSIGDACSESTPASGGILSSGWFDETDLPLFCQKPANKCAHGFIGSCGLNKDYPGRGPRFDEARQLAIRATHVFTRETLEAVIVARSRLQPALSSAAAQQAVNLAVCEFMGVPDPVSTCTTSYTVIVQKLNKANGQSTLEGLVQSSGGTITPAIDCGLLCEGIAIAGTSVQLTAKNNGNWKFVRWTEGGVCAGSTSPDCSFVVDSNKTAKAEFIEDEFGFEVAESEAPWSPENPRLNCFHYEGEYLVTGYVASFDRCYSGMSAVIRCVGSSCDSSRFKVAISKSILSFTDGTCNSYQDPYGADPGSAQTYVPGSNWWFGLGEGWTKAWPSVSEISPLANGNSIFQNFHWIGDDPGAACVGDQTRTLELEFNVYDVTTGTYTKIPFVINVP
jgi:hypothetical protein